MNPLIQQMASLEPEEALNYQWFDMTPVYKVEQTVDGSILERPLPYPLTALVCAYEDKKVLLLINRVEAVTGVVGRQLDKKSYRLITTFTYTVDEEGIKCRHLDGTHFDYRTSPATGVIAFIATFLESIDTQPAVGYIPAKRANWEKKIRQGNAPTYDWTTVVIEPRKPRSEDQGGTHASPRWHERRGHWRTFKSGKQVWVKNCAVGDKSKGAVFHDYQIKEST